MKEHLSKLPPKKEKSDEYKKELLAYKSKILEPLTYILWDTKGEKTLVEKNVEINLAY